MGCLTSVKMPYSWVGSGCVPADLEAKGSGALQRDRCQPNNGGTVNPLFGGTATLKVQCLWLPTLSVRTVLASASDWVFKGSDFVCVWMVSMVFIKDACLVSCTCLNPSRVDDSCLLLFAQPVSFTNWMQFKFPRHMDSNSNMHGS